MPKDIRFAGLHNHPDFLDWAAGFIEGDGGIYLPERNPLMVKCSQKYRPPLYVLRKGIGGSINLYSNGRGAKVYSQWIYYDTDNSFSTSIAGLLGASNRTKLRSFDIDVGQVRSINKLWIAGFYEAEGSITLAGKNRATPQLEISQYYDAAFLHEIQARLGYGKVYGPYKEKAYGYRAYCGDVRRFFQDVGQFLSPRRIRQFRSVLDGR